MLERIFLKRAPMDSRWGRMVWIGSKNPHPFNRQFIYLARGAIVKHHGSSYSFDAWEIALIGHKSQEVNIYGAGHFLRTLECWRRTRPAMPKTTLCAGLIVIEAWFGGY